MSDIKKNNWQKFRAQKKPLPKWQTDIFDKYPTLFNSNKKYSVPSTGMECRKGWQYLIDHTLSNLYNTMRIDGRNMEIEITQIKQKYGELRIYFSLNKLRDQKFLHILQKITQQASESSRQMCEVCGYNGELLCDQTDPKQLYVQTLCDKHRSIYNIIFSIKSFWNKLWRIK